MLFLSQKIGQETEGKGTCKASVRPGITVSPTLQLIFLRVLPNLRTIARRYTVRVQCLDNIFYMHFTHLISKQSTLRWNRIRFAGTWKDRRSSVASIVPSLLHFLTRAATASPAPVHPTKIHRQFAPPMPTSYRLSSSLLVCACGAAAATCLSVTQVYSCKRHRTRTL